MSEDAEPKPWYKFDLPELKPVQAFGRVWKVWELNVIWFFGVFFDYLVLRIFLGHWISFSIVFCASYILGRRWEKYSEQCETPYIVINSSDEEKKLPSKEEVAEWTKKNSEYFMAWNKRQYKASKSWFGQKREDWAEWRHQRKLARYKIVAMPDQGVITAVDQVMEPAAGALEPDAMSKMLEEDPAAEPAEEIQEDAEPETIVIPAAPIFKSSQKPASTPRKPLVDYDRVPMYVRRATRVFYSILVAFYALAMLNFAYDKGLFDFFYSEFVVERLLSEYPGTEVGLKPRAVILGILFLCTSLLMLIGYRPFVTMLILSSSLILSIMMRLDFADPLADGSAHLLKDITWSMLFIVFCSITFFAKEPDIVHPLLGPQELISASPDDDTGDTLELMKPKRPTRRARPLFFYEGVFLLISAILWPAALFSLAALASAELRESMGLPGDFDSGTMSGQLFLGILFVLAAISTYIVYKFDREARDAPMYAKEMEAYVKHMEHWININNDYYEREHARLTADLPKSSEE